MWCVGLVHQSFNRYMVECESQMNRQSAWVNGVLIDTWWNVNCRNWRRQLQVFIVLIDTWWNVNKILAIKSHKILTVLIDTWWNVNSFK